MGDHQSMGENDRNDKKEEEEDITDKRCSDIKMAN